MTTVLDLWTVCWCVIAMTIGRGVVALPAQIERMTVSKMEKADLETSATGYAYNHRHGGPASYVRYDNRGAGHYYRPPVPVHYVNAAGPVPVAYPVPAPVPYRGPVPVTKPVVQYEPASYPYAKQYVVPAQSPKGQPLAPYYVPVKVEKNQRVEALDNEYNHDEDDDDNDDDDNDDDEEEEEEEDHDDGDHHGHDIAHGDFEVPTKNFGFQRYNEPKKIVALELDIPTKVVAGLSEPHKAVATSFEQGGGETHNAEEYAAHGEKGDKGYKSQHVFDKGESGEHDNEHKEGHYSEEGGHSKGHSEVDGHYANHEAATKGDKGGTFGKSAYHKKGHKTTGFHNVYHKDEYKKKTEFYDDNHKAGHFDKHASFDEHHNAAKGGFEKGGHHDSSHSEAEGGKEGHHDKGHVNSEHKGHKAAEGQEAYHEEQADYADKGGSSSAKEHGYSEGHTHHGKHLD